MYSDERAASSLAKFLSEFDYAMIDTCSLMEDAFPLWMDVLNNAKSYLNNEIKVRVPRECYEELKRHARNKADAERRIAAQRAIKIIKKAKWAKLLEVSKRESKKNFADHVIYVRVSTDRLEQKILIITQDKKLATDLIALNALASQRGRLVKVFKFKDDGTLVPNHGEGLHQGDKWVKPLFNGKKPVGKPSQPLSKPKPQPAKPNGNMNAVVDFDTRLKSTLTNPTYPVERKIEDLRQQLNTLSKLSAEQIEALNLNYSAADIKKLIIEMQSQKPAAKKPANTPKKPSDSQQQVAKPENKPIEQPKPEEPKPEAPKQEPAKPKQPDLGWYEVAREIPYALRKICAHYNVLVRSADIAYDPVAHGAIDLTDADIDAIADMLSKAPEGQRYACEYHGYGAAVEKTKDNMFKVWFNLVPVEKQVKPAPQKPVEEKPAPAPEKKAKPKKAKKPEAAKPEPEKKPEPAAEKPKPEAKKKPSKPKKTAQPEKPAEEKPAPSAKPVEEAPKAAEKKAKPKKAKKAEEPKPEPKPEETPAPAKKPALSNFEKAEKADRNLRANLSNPNYSKERKLKDAQSQIKRLKKLSADERAKLFYSEDALNQFIASLGE